jgi:toxin ParE1/3/4
VSTKYGVSYTRTAEADIREIWSYIGVASRSTADSFILEMQQQIATLEKFPARCAVIPERDSLSSSYRHLIFGAYRTIFRISGKTVYILRVIHGARLLDTSALDSITQSQEK